VFPALAVAIHAVAAALPGAAPSALSAVPFIAASVVGLSIVATHNPAQDLVAFVRGTPEIAAECIQRTAEAHPSRLAAVSQPLYGAAIYGVVLKRGGAAGDPLVTVVIQDAGAGSSAEFRPVTSDQQAELIEAIIAACRRSA
jgi:hypothetical protein